MTSRVRPNVIVVGAGSAGIGTAAALKDFGVEDLLVLDRYGIGASFDRWPAEMRFITPSFNSTPFGLLDLNAVAVNTSVANFLGQEHPAGKDYVRYLEAVVEAWKIPVRCPWEVSEVERKTGGGFILRGPHGTLECRFLVWAPGEFQYPFDNPFPGADLCLHNSRIRSYQELPGDDFLIIGAFESGADAAVHLAACGKTVTLLSAEQELATSDQDPSRSLSPFTRERLERTLARSDKLAISFNSRVCEVVQTGECYLARTMPEGKEFSSTTPPVLATGFRGGTGPVQSLFEHREDGFPLLTENDESTVADGLFLAGPLVRHDSHIFCFIYKYRQRFAIIAETIAERSGIEVPNTVLETYELNQMRLLDLSSCGEDCTC